MIPAAVIGVGFEDVLETFFESKIHLVSFFLICTCRPVLVVRKSIEGQPAAGL